MNTLRRGQNKYLQKVNHIAKDFPKGLVSVQ